MAVIFVDRLCSSLIGLIHIHKHVFHLMCASNRKAAVVANVFIKYPETYLDSAFFSVSASACHTNIHLFSTSQATLKGL